MTRLEKDEEYKKVNGVNVPLKIKNCSEGHINRVYVPLATKTRSEGNINHS